MSERTPLDAVGIGGPSFLIDLELGKLREFARSTDAPADPYLITRTPPVTPTFLTVSRLWEQDSPWPRLGFAQSRVLHAEQEYVFHGPPPRVGTELEGKSTIEDVYTKDGRRGRMTFATMATAFRDGSGRVVAEARMKGVEVPGAEGRPPAASAPLSPRPAEPPADTAAEGLPAAPAATRHGPLTVTDFVRYQGASGDMNPLHHDPERARAAGFRAPISVGMLQAGFLASYAVRWLGAERIRRFRVRFHAPVLAGDTVSCQPAAPLKRSDGTAEAHLSCTVGTGELAVQAWALFDLGSAEISPVRVGDSPPGPP